jgi:hypothetical protein
VDCIDVEGLVGEKGSSFRSQAPSRVLARQGWAFADDSKFPAKTLGSLVEKYRKNDAWGEPSASDAETVRKLSPRWYQERRQAPVEAHQ